MIFQYNPYSAGQNQYGVNNPFSNQQQQGPKTFSIPTWLIVLMVIGFIGLAVGLWFLL